MPTTPSHEIETPPNLTLEEFWALPPGETSYEHDLLPETSETLVYLAMLRIMIRRLA